MLENTGKDKDNTNKAELKKQKRREYHLKTKEQFKERYQRYRENDIETFRRRIKKEKRNATMKTLKISGSVAYLL